MQRQLQRSRLLRPVAALALILSLIGSVLVIGHVRAQADSPVGQWSVALTRNDVPVDVASSFSYIGQWRLGIDEDGTYQAERSDTGVMVEGQWAVDGDRITFTDESGLLSCSNPAAAPIITQDMDSGVYSWQRDEKTLTLTRVDDACPGRPILLTTFSFSKYVACATQPLTAAELLGSPVASPVAQPEPIPQATAQVPVASPAEPGPPLPGAQTGGATSLGFDTAIDDLLAQLTACWATRDPARWLPLLSTEFQQTLIQSDPNFLETLTVSMSSPIVWERSGEITIEAPNRISAIVKSTVGTEEDFQRFVFIFEDGQWKWDG